MPKFAVTSFPIAEEKNGLTVRDIVTTYVSCASKKLYLCVHWISSTPSKNGFVQSGEFTFLELIVHIGKFRREYTLIDKGRKEDA